MSAICRVCSHPDRNQIDHAIVAGQSQRRIADQFGISASSVGRHRRQHIPATLARAQSLQEDERARGLVEQLLGIHDRTMAILERAEESGSLTTALTAIREARTNLELIGKFTGELVERHAHLHQRIDPAVVVELRDAFQALVSMEMGAGSDIRYSRYVHEGRDALPATIER
jgi:hypothetical protein